MKLYADYHFYTNEYSAESNTTFQKESDFLPFSMKATQSIKQYTFNNVPEDIPEEVKMCCCELAESLFKYDKLLNGNTVGMTSQHIGDLSVNYESSASISQNQSKEVKQIIYRWLSGTGLLYRGVY